MPGFINFLKSERLTLEPCNRLKEASFNSLRALQTGVDSRPGVDIDGNTADISVRNLQDALLAIQANFDQLRQLLQLQQELNQSATRTETAALPQNQ